MINIQALKAACQRYCRKTAAAASSSVSGVVGTISREGSNGLMASKGCVLMRRRLLVRSSFSAGDSAERQRQEQAVLQGFSFGERYTNIYFKKI